MTDRVGDKLAWEAAKRESLPVRVRQLVQRRQRLAVQRDRLTSELAAIDAELDALRRALTSENAPENEPSPSRGIS